MGGFFSRPKVEITADEYAKQKAALDQQVAEQTVVVKQAEHDNIQILNAQFERQKRIARQRINEIEETLQRAAFLRELRRQQNIKTAVLLCALYYNYPFGVLTKDTLDMDTSKIEGDNSWQGNALTIIRTVLSEDVFKIVCKIPQLLPLFWPTGASPIEEKFHQYKDLDASGQPKLDTYIATVNTYIEQYLNGPLPVYLTNVFLSNSLREMEPNTDYHDQLYEACRKFILSVEMCKDDMDLIFRCESFIANDDPLHWKGFVARANKGICKLPIKILPATYPKRYPKYELYEAVLIVTNAAISQYGFMQDETTGAPVPLKVTAQSKKKVTKKFSECTELQQTELRKSGVQYNSDDIVEVEDNFYEYDLSKYPNTTIGGKCFELNDKWVQNCYKLAISDQIANKLYWDYNSFILTSQIRLTAKDITGEPDDNVWMQNTVAHDVRKAYFANPTDAALGIGGTLRYANPTQKYTYELLNDTDENGGTLTFKLPLLSTDINDIFRRTFLRNAVELLTTKKENEEFDLYRTVNKDLFTSFDYMTMIAGPNMFIEDYEDEVYPLAKYIYQSLIKQSCRWSITVPLMNTVSMSQINDIILNDELNKYGKESLPQNIWTRTKNISRFTEVVQTSSLCNDPPPPPQILTDSVFTVDNIKHIQEPADQPPDTQTPANILRIKSTSRKQQARINPEGKLQAPI